MRPYEYDNHHGHTAAAWTGVTIATVAVLVGSAGVLADSRPILIVGAALLVASCVVGKVMQLMGLGQTDHPAHAGRRLLDAIDACPAVEPPTVSETAG